jgi:hypothetical protein
MKKIRDGQTIIGMLEGGQLAASLGTEITETLAKLKELAGDRPKNVVKGSVTLKVELKVENGTVEVECHLDSKRPKPARARSFYWVLDDGSLSTEHPQQTDMFNGPREARTRENA